MCADDGELFTRDRREGQLRRLESRSVNSAMQEKLFGGACVTPDEVENVKRCKSVLQVGPAQVSPVFVRPPLPMTVMSSRRCAPCQTATEGKQTQLKMAVPSVTALPCSNVSSAELTEHCSALSSFHTLGVRERLSIQSQSSV